MKIHELFLQLTRDEVREIVFVWVPCHFGIRGNLATDAPAKNALDGDVTDEFVPFSDFKPRIYKYMFDRWQQEWDEYPQNKLYRIRPRLNEYLPLSSSGRQEGQFSPVYTLAIRI